MLIIWRIILFSRKVILGICLSFFLQYVLAWPVSWFTSLLVPDIFSLGLVFVTYLGALSWAEEEENLLTITGLMVYIASLHWTHGSNSKPLGSCDLIVFRDKKETRKICMTLVLVDFIFLPKFIKRTKHIWKQIVKTNLECSPSSPIVIYLSSSPNMALPYFLINVFSFQVRLFTFLHFTYIFLGNGVGRQWDRNRREDRRQILLWNSTVNTYSPDTETFMDLLQCCLIHFGSC